MKENNDTLTERKIIEIIRKHLNTMPELPIPFGDDVSAFSLEDGRVVVLKTDMLVGKTDIPKGMNLFQAARKAIVMNVSDFAAKGVQPIAILVSLGLPKGLSRRDVTSIAEGLNKGAHEFGAYIIGGDTGEASDLVVSVTLFGLGEKESIPLRSGAKPDDIIAVTGKFGKTSAGLKILLSNCISSPNMRRSLINSVLYPNARLKEGIALTKSRSVSASIDSSDGLAWSLYELSQASNVGFVIDDLPAADEAMSFAKLNKLDIVELTLYGGEEYELVLTIKPDLWKKAVEIVEKVGGRLLNIGRITKTKKMILKTYSREIFVEPRGYEHFRN